MEHITFQTKDGASLYALDAGRGGVPVLCIHGNSCDHSFLAPQIEHFAARRRVIAPDLRGHGRSDKPDCNYTFALMADDLADLIVAMNVGRVVAVGHSMGGAVALELAYRHPELAAGVACLDSTVVSPAGRHGRIAALLEGLRSESYRSYFLRHFESSFEPTDDQARKQAILERMLTTPRHVTISLFEQWRVADGQAALRALDAPILYVASSRPRSDAAELRALCPNMFYGQVVGAGHFLTLEAPGQVNAMLDRFLELCGL